jgi:hypothetical protein
MYCMRVAIVRQYAYHTVQLALERCSAPSTDVHKMRCIYGHYHQSSNSYASLLAQSIILHCFCVMHAALQLNHVVADDKHAAMLFD